MEKVTPVREALLSWGRQHGRTYPWRETRDPYRILIAEVLLHRTRASQVRPVYERLIAEYPDLTSLLAADPERIAALLRPLGLHWRMTLLLDMIRTIDRKYGGEIPLTREDLMGLPGVGDYITSALLTFTGTSREPVMDTNTVRVIGRVFGLELTDQTRRRKNFRVIMILLVDSPDAIAVSLSIIDLAALVCLPRNPRCDSCVLRSFCVHAMKKESSE